jgi:hypothetical protein
MYMGIPPTAVFFGGVFFALRGSVRRPTAHQSFPCCSKSDVASVPVAR